MGLHESQPANLKSLQTLIAINRSMVKLYYDIKNNLPEECEEDKIESYIDGIRENLSNINDVLKGKNYDFVNSETEMSFPDLFFNTQDKQELRKYCKELNIPEKYAKAWLCIYSFGNIYTNDLRIGIGWKDSLKKYAETLQEARKGVNEGESFEADYDIEKPKNPNDPVHGFVDPKEFTEGLRKTLAEVKKT